MTTLRAPLWRDDSLCARPEYSFANWFPENGDADRAHVTTTAKAVCHACPVRAACLEDALAAEGSSGAAYRHGIRGGLTPKERRAVYERRRDTASAA
ncbi:WhiB family transcriptional regulator [Streptomyces sp. NPDC029526]|uniref:WhiB family transcriptional regulator n=1 Tax=Streptomyces sp. NPDC029526 TaxID=3155728 RepID=UPI0033F1B071